MNVFWGVDTSCYTTSMAVTDGQRILWEGRRPLVVPEGARGLRQSDMVFQHIRSVAQLSHEGEGSLPSVFSVKGVAASVRPRPQEGSYMPVFTVAESVGRSIAMATGAEFYALTHQHAHIGASLIGQDFEGQALALHVSGGTTELLLVLVEQGCIRSVEKLGGTLDIAAGQLIDRVAVTGLGLSFPGGPPLERLAAQGTQGAQLLKVSAKGMDLNLSGAETQAVRLLEKGAPGADVALAVLHCVAKSLETLIRAGRKQHGPLPVLLFGGVMSNGYIRRHLTDTFRGLVFADPSLAPDNACGLAMQAARLWQEKNG